MNSNSTNSLGPPPNYPPPHPPNEDVSLSGTIHSIAGITQHPIVQETNIKVQAGAKQEIGHLTTHEQQAKMTAHSSSSSPVGENQSKIKEVVTPLLNKKQLEKEKRILERELDSKKMDLAEVKLGREIAVSQESSKSRIAQASQSLLQRTESKEIKLQKSLNDLNAEAAKLNKSLPDLTYISMRFEREVKKLKEEKKKLTGEKFENLRSFPIIGQKLSSLLVQLTSVLNKTKIKKLELYQQKIEKSGDKASIDYLQQHFKKDSISNSIDKITEQLKSIKTLIDNLKIDISQDLHTANEFKNAENDLNNRARILEEEVVTLNQRINELDQAIKS